MTRMLRKLGGSQLVPPETFHVIGREGPLFDGEVNRAEEWTRTLVADAALKRNNSLELAAVH